MSQTKGPRQTHFSFVIVQDELFIFFRATLYDIDRNVDVESSI